MIKLFSMLTIFVLALLLQYASMMWGWGLEPKSHLWIIGPIVANAFLLSMLQVIEKE